MKKIFYIMVLGIGLASCSNSDNELLPTNNFPEDHVIRVTTVVNKPMSRAGYDATNLDAFGLIIRNSENTAYNYDKKMIGSGSVWNTSDGTKMLWDATRTPVTVVAYAPYINGVDLDTPLPVEILSNQSTAGNVKASDFLLMKARVNPEQNLTPEGKLNISLNHMMSKLIIKIKINGTEDAAMSKLGDMSINGALINGTCDLSTETPVVVPLANATTATVVSYKGISYNECILLPQTISEGFSVNFSYDGKLYIWTAKDAIELQKGVEYTLTLNVNTTAQLAAMQTRNWATGQLIGHN